MGLNRRQFAQITGTAVLSRSMCGQTPPLTAQQIVERIQKNAGVDWQEKTVDSFKAGDPSTVVTGIATTAMANMDVLTRAIKEKTNLVVTLEPTFFGQSDGQQSGGGRGQAGVSAQDPIYLAKQEFIRKNGLVIWRFSDHWRLRKPDPFTTGLGKTLGWTKYQVGDDTSRYDLPAGTLGSLVDDLAKRLQAGAGIRVVGDPQSRVRRIYVLPGVSALAATMKQLPDCDVIVAGETREWESVEYAQDTVASGQKKGLIMLGRVVSEEPGMSVCADWLKSIVSEVPVRWIPASDPYWRPA